MQSTDASGEKGARYCVCDAPFGISQGTHLIPKFLHHGCFPRNNSMHPIRGSEFCAGTADLAPGWATISDVEDHRYTCPWAGSQHMQCHARLVNRRAKNRIGLIYVRPQAL